MPRPKSPLGVSIARVRHADTGRLEDAGERMQRGGKLQWPAGRPQKMLPRDGSKDRPQRSGDLQWREWNGSSPTLPTGHRRSLERVEASGGDGAVNAPHRRQSAA